MLVGDSTLAPQTGYGDALCALLDPEAECLNLARGGRSTKSFRADGSWDRVSTALAEGGPKRETFVLIQFGHNDQPGKAERTTELATEFPANLERYVAEVRAAGATAILGTPLTRRTFRDGVLVNDLSPWADAIRRLAAARQVALVDMNAASSAGVAQLGPHRADSLARDPPHFDRTHVGARGAAYFSRMAARLLADAQPTLAPRFNALATRPELSASHAERFSERAVLDGWDPLTEATRALELRPMFVVDGSASPDGERTFATIQSAVNAAVTLGNGPERIVIAIRPGTYRELVYIPSASSAILLSGTGNDPGAVKVTATLDARVGGADYEATFGAAFRDAPAAVAAMFDAVRSRETVGTSGSAIAWIRNSGFQARNITFENAFHKVTGNTQGKSQAVAVLVEDADRASFEHVRFIGYQDTLYLRASEPARPPRVFVRDSYVEGDVDFIFGEARAYFLRTEVKSLGDHGESYALAPSTHRASPFGFVFRDCRFTHDGSANALRGTFKLARQWYRGGDADAVGKVAILDSRIGAHIDKSRPWADWGFPGSPRYRPVQYDSGGPAFEPWLSEFRSLDE